MCISKLSIFNRNYVTSRWIFKLIEYFVRSLTLGWISCDGTGAITRVVTDTSDELERARVLPGFLVFLWDFFRIVNFREICVEWNRQRQLSCPIRLVSNLNSQTMSASFGVRQTKRRPRASTCHARLFRVLNSSQTRTCTDQWPGWNQHPLRRRFGEI